MRSAVAARFLTLRVLTDSTLPPLIRLSGHNPSQDVNAGPWAKREKSGPISAKRVCVVRTLIPGTRGKSTPKMRWRLLADRTVAGHCLVFAPPVISPADLRADPLSIRTPPDTAQFLCRTLQSTLGNDETPGATGGA